MTTTYKHLGAEERGAIMAMKLGGMSARSIGQALARAQQLKEQAQLDGWLRGFGLAAGRVAALPIETIVPDADVCGPVPHLADRVRSLHARYYDAHY